MTCSNKGLPTKKRLLIFPVLLILIYPKAPAQDYFNRHRENKLISCVDGDLIHTFYINPNAGVSKVDKDKEYFWFKNFKLHHSQGGFQGNLLDGNYKLVTRGDKVVQVGSFKKGLKEGEWKEWHDSGKLLKIVTWSSGKKEGPFWEYNRNGKLVLHGHFKDAKLHGKLTEYGSRGAPVVSAFKDGELIDKERIAHEKEARKLEKQEERQRKKEERQTDKTFVGDDGAGQPLNKDSTANKKAKRRIGKQKPQEMQPGMATSEEATATTIKRKEGKKRQPENVTQKSENNKTKRDKNTTKNGKIKKQKSPANKNKIKKGKNATKNDKIKKEKNAAKGDKKTPNSRKNKKSGQNPKAGHGS